jgi:hypothetical protein
MINEQHADWCALQQLEKDRLAGYFFLINQMYFSSFQDSSDYSAVLHDITGRL